MTRHKQRPEKLPRDFFRPRIVYWEAVFAVTQHSITFSSYQYLLYHHLLENLSHTSSTASQHSSSDKLSSEDSLLNNSLKLTSSSSFGIDMQ